MKRARAARAMVLASRVAYDNEGNGDGGKSNGNEGDRQATATKVMAKVKATMTTSAVAVAEMVMATAMVTAMAEAMTTERGSAKDAKGKQATAKVNRRSSSTQHNNQPTTKWGMAKVAREKQVAHRSK
jgi:hypothetical protein